MSVNAETPAVKMPSGMFFCPAHHGVMNEDEEVCDRAEPWWPGRVDCNRYPLWYDGK